MRNERPFVYRCGETAIVLTFYDFVPVLWFVPVYRAVRSR